MTDAYLVPLPVQIGTGETTVYTTPASTSTMLTVRIVNATAATRTISGFCYSGAGPGTDANRALPEDFSLLAGQMLEVGPLYLTTGYKFTMTCDSANGVTATPNGIETT